MRYHLLRGSRSAHVGGAKSSFVCGRAASVQIPRLTVGFEFNASPKIEKKFPNIQRRGISDSKASRSYLLGSCPKRMSRSDCRRSGSLDFFTSQVAVDSPELRLTLAPMSQNDFTWFGYKESWGNNQVPFGMATADRRHHVYVIGKTGSGKTTFLRNLIVQHIAAGHGVGLLDPHGDLAQSLLEVIPPCRTDHLVYFNPADLEFPVGLNLLANVAKDERHLVASGIVSAFKSIWRESWGPRMEYILYNCIAGLLDCENTSILGLTRVLTDPVYREWMIRQIEDPFVRKFWTEEFASYDERFLREAISPIQNKVGQFLTNPPIRNTLGQVRSKIDIRYTMDTNRVFIANLAKGKLGEDKANLLGSLLVTQFQLAAMRRADIPEDERQDFFLFIDEFQNFTTDAFASILSEARKYRLNLTLSHQYIAQLSPEIRDAVFGNVGSLIAFRLGHSDAPILESEFGDAFIQSQFTELGRFEILVKHLQDGTTREPFRAKTFAPEEKPYGRTENMIRRSRERFATPRDLVETRINRWLNSHEPKADSRMKQRPPNLRERRRFDNMASLQ